MSHPITGEQDAKCEPKSLKKPASHRDMGLLENHIDAPVPTIGCIGIQLSYCI
jgi:hypothetical protein